MEKIFIKELNLSTRTNKILEKANIETLEDLLQYSSNINHSNSLYRIKGLGKISIKEIIDKIHKLDYSFFDEKEITSEKNPENIPLEDLLFSIQIYRLLIRANIHTLKDLLDYSITNKEYKNSLYKLSFLGEIKVKKIIDRVHELGYKFMDEIEIQKEENPKNILIEQLNLPTGAYCALKRTKEIHTLEDLLQYSTKKDYINNLYSIKNIGASIVKDITDRVHELGYRFIDEIEIQEEAKNKKILIEQLNFTGKIYRILKYYCKIHTLEDLLKYSTNKFDSKNLYNISYLGPTSVEKIIEKVHELGYKFINEIEVKKSIENNIILIENLYLTNRTYKALKRFGKINTLEELLQYSARRDHPNSLYKIKGMGKISVKEIIDKVYSLGCRFIDEKEIIKEDKDENTLIEQLYFTARIYNALKKYTKVRSLKDLLQYSTNEFDSNSLYNIPSLGNLSVEEIIGKVHGLGYKFINEMKKEQSNELISNADEKNTILKETIKKKEELVSKYQELLNEKQELIKREEYLDLEIAKVIESLNLIQCGDTIVRQK